MAEEERTRSPAGRSLQRRLCSLAPSAPDETDVANTLAMPFRGDQSEKQKQNKVESVLAPGATTCLERGDTQGHRTSTAPEAEDGSKANGEG